MPRVLFISSDPFGELLAGPAVRCRELAAACAATGLDVTVAVPGGKEHVPAGCRGVSYDPLYEGALSSVVAETDAIVAQGLTLSRYPAVAEAKAPVAVDLYCPFLIENLERERCNPARADQAEEWERTYLNELRAVNAALARGDFFLCADDRQRDYWLGALTALHRVSPSTYGDDPQLRELIAAVPFGCPPDPPTDGPPVMRGVVPGLTADSEILLWGGSLSPWFDLETLIAAMQGVRALRPTAALVFLGTHHPNADVPPSPAAAAARAQAQRLGLLDDGVYFLPWVPYADRGRYLREATVGVSTQGIHLETHLSFRTRLVDYLWAGLPMVLSRGDDLGTRCTAAGAALSVPPENADALRDTLVRALEDSGWRDRARAACARISREFAWPTVAEPLVTWLTNPRRAADARGLHLRAAVVPPVGDGPTSASEQELAALRAEAARARELDARLRSVDRKLRVLEGMPGVGRFLKRRRES